MRKEQALLLEAHRKLSNNYKFHTELNRILRTQVEPEIYKKAEEQARTICQKRFKKIAPEVAKVLKDSSVTSCSESGEKK